MKPETQSRWYERRRNELLALLAEAAALDLPEKYAEELRAAVCKCQEDAFEIALVGEFQGGKSTTFNALCDGRDISPRGHGIKTSAAVISAQNIAGDETRDGLSEWAEVKFKSKSAIALGLSTLLRHPLMDSPELRALNGKLSDQEYENAMATDDTFPTVVDLDNPRCLALLRQSADALWRRWEADRANALSSDELDQLRIATLQLRFYGTDEQESIQKRTILPLDRFQRLVAFPHDWESRWREGRNARFDFGEVAFVFVHSVLLRLHSDNLKRVGCRITDCPGLFANAFDTSVAEKAIRNADAVWYLIEGEKQLGDKDKKCLRKISDWGLSGKIQATANIRTEWEIKSTEILAATKSMLSNMGLSFGVIPYNARLAFLAEQGKLLLETPERFGDLDLQNMKIDAKSKEDNPDPVNMWSKMVRRIGSAMAVESLEDADALDAESVDAARNASHFGDILSRLENDVIPRKAESLLVNRGSDRAAKALARYEGVLQATEKAAKEEEAKWRSELKSARRQLDAFVQRAHKIINRSVLGVSLTQTAQVLSNEILCFALDDQYVTNLSFHVARKFLDTCTSLKMALSKKRMADELARILPPDFADESKNAMSRALEKWKKEGKTRKDLRHKTELVCGDIHDLWIERKIDAVEMLEGFETPSVQEEDIAALCDELSASLFEKRQLANTLMAARNIWAEMWRVFVERFLTSLLDSVWMAIDPITFGLHEEAKKQKREKRIGEIAGKIKKTIEPAVNDVRFRDSIGVLLETQLSLSLGKLADQLRTRLEDLKTDFEKERVARPEKMFGQSAAERKRIAAKNRSIRTKTIAPLRKRIEAFKAAVTAELGSA